MREKLLPILLGVAVVAAAEGVAALQGGAAPPAGREELDRYGQPVRAQDGSPRLYDRDALETARAAAALAPDPAPSLKPRAAGAPATPLAFEAVWRSSVLGSGIGHAGLVSVDLDGDAKEEIVAGGSTSTFGANDFWYILAHDPVSGGYPMRWATSPLDSAVTALAVHRVAGAQRIFVGRDDGLLQIHRGADPDQLESRAAAEAAILRILLADADNDGSEDLVLLLEDALLLLDPLSLAERKRFAYGASDVAIGNVDGDARLEVVLASGLVLELTVAGAAVEWDYRSAGFGWRLGLADFDGDGAQEIVGAAGWYAITVFGAVVRSPLWEIEADLDVDALLLADVTGDGVAEILYGDGQWGEIHAISAATRGELWSIPNPEHGVTRIAIGDPDSDGEREVLWGSGHSSTGADALFVHALGDRSREFASTHVDGSFAAVGVGDADGDGRDELVGISWSSESGYADGVVFVHDAESFALEWQSGSALFGGHAWTGVRDVAVGEVDGDPDPEIVVATDRLYDGALYVLDGKTRSVEASYFYDDGSPMSALALADLDGDGRAEIVAGNDVAHTGSPGTFLWVVDGATGAVFWKSTSLAAGFFAGVQALAVGDVSGDGKPEIVAVNGALHIVDGANRAQRRSTRTNYTALELVDPDGDGTHEILAGTSDGGIERIHPSSFAATPLGSACGDEVRSLAAETEALDGAVAFACGDGIGVYGLFEQSVLWSTEAIGPRPGLSDNIQASARGARARLVVGTATGLIAFEGFGPGDSDLDGDGVPNYLDNCPELENPDQIDTDGDETGDACNDADDADGDEFADSLDNCVDLPNPAQADGDQDGVGDLCDENPDDGPACDGLRQEALVLAAELAECLARPSADDGDGDGEIDGRDACPGTPAGAAIDAAGCSLDEFCAALPVSGVRQAMTCYRGDWRGDEAWKVLPRDCKVEFPARKWSEDSRCIARPAPPSEPK